MTKPNHAIFLAQTLTWDLGTHQELSLIPRKSTFPGCFKAEELEIYGTLYFAAKPNSLKKIY